MQRVAVDDAPLVPSTARASRDVAAPVGLEGVAAIHYVLDPGDSLSPMVHAHHDQQEVFYVLSGTVAFETETEAFTLEAGEIVRFEPGEFQYGANESDDPATVLALGVPAGSDRVEMDCPDCGRRVTPAIESTADGDVRRFLCPDCGAVAGEQTR